MSFGLALSTGHESEAEYLDLVFAEEVDLDRGRPRSPMRCPTAWPCQRAPLVDRAPALQEAVTAVGWRVEPVDAAGAPIDASRPVAHVERALELPTMPTSRRRKGRDVNEDVRPIIRRCELSTTRIR